MSTDFAMKKGEYRDIRVLAQNYNAVIMGFQQPRNTEIFLAGGLPSLSRLNIGVLPSDVTLFDVPTADPSDVTMTPSPDYRASKAPHSRRYSEDIL